MFSIGNPQTFVVPLPKILPVFFFWGGVNTRFVNCRGSLLKR